MKVYISGPMRNIDGFNFPAFFQCEAELREAFGARIEDVCNPAREDVVRFGLQDLLDKDPSGLEAGRSLDGVTFGEAELRDALGRDMAYIAEHCTDIVMLPGWENSKGALAEKALAEALGLHVGYFTPQEPQEGPSEALDPVVDPLPTDAGLGDRGAPVASPAGETRLTSATGGQKGSKLAKFSQISPEVMWLVAEHFGKGARKYAAHNFRKGYEWSLSYDALCRHLADFWSGKEYDVCPDGCSTWEGETTEHGHVCINHTGSLHIVAVIWHAMVLTEFFLHRKEYDDRYVYASNQQR